MKTKAFKAAFPMTISIMMGFIFLSLAYGIYMNASGFSFVYPMIMSIVIYGGSLEFVCVEMLLSPFMPLETFIMALLIQARHIFYGISMLEKYKGLGWKKYYLIFSLCDETFSLNYNAEIPEGVDRGWFYFFVSFLDHLYWVLGATMGGIAGSFLNFSPNGISFVMTAMFTVIFVEQWLKEKNHTSSIVGLLASAACLFIFGKNSFLIPSMLSILVLLTLSKNKIDKEE